MDNEILDYIKRNKRDIEDMINNSEIGTITELIISKSNIKLFLEIRDKLYIQNKVNILIFSKIYKVLKVGNKIGIIRESFNYNLYEWLQTNPSLDDIKIIKNQLNRLDSILDKKIDKLENIWIKRINKGFPVIIRGNKIVHNGYLVGILNLGTRKISIKRINNEIREKNLRRLYGEEELERMYSNIIDISSNNIYNDIVKNKLDNELILRRLMCGRIAKLL